MNPTDEPPFSGDFAPRARLALRAALRTLLVVVPLAFLSILAVARPPELAALVCLFVVLVGLTLIERTAKARHVVAGLVAALLAYGVGGLIAYGSIRGTASLALVAAIVNGGMFLGRRALAATVLFCALALGAIAYAESAGWLPAPNIKIGLVQWLVYVLALVAIAANLHYARGLLLAALRRSEQDMRERVRAEHARGEAEDLFGALFGSSPAALMITELDEGRIVDLNQAYVDTFGWARAEAIGRTTVDLDLWAHAPDRTAFRSEVRLRSRLRNHPCRLRRSNGEAFDALVSAEVVDWRGARHMFSTVTDISAELALRDTVKRSEQVFETIFRESPLGMIITDFDRAAVIDVNAAASRVLGIGKDEWLGNGVRPLYVDPAQHDRLRAELERSGHVHNLPLRLRHGDGGTREFLASAALFRDGPVRHSINMIVDVTAEVKAREALEASEARFASAFNFIPIGMTITRIADGRIVEVNQADERTLGYPRGETIGRTTIDTGAWATAEDRERFISLLRRDGRVMGYDTRMCNKAGEVIDARLFAERIEFGGEPCVLAATLNVTAEKRSEAEILALNEGLEARVRQRTGEIEKANAALAAANQDLEAFAYSVSHDLRAPLRWINGYTSMLATDYAQAMPAQAHEILERIQGAAARMEGIIEDMLRLSSVIRAELHPRQVDISVLAAHIAAQIGDADPARQAEWRIAPGLAAVADAGMLSLILENLMGNAWKYSARTAAPVIEVLQSERTAERVEMCVRDNGVGFDMAYAGRLFKPFRRLHAQNEFPGNGIGLATVHRILQKHGGSIRAEAAPGRGAAFYFSLPNLEGTTPPAAARQ